MHIAHTSRKDQIAIVGQQEKRKAQIHQGTLRPHRGHKVWEFNIQTREIKEAEVEKTDFVLTESGSAQARKKIVTKPFCRYCSALNRENAAKHFFHMLNAELEDIK